jgi:hypothetical protein
METKRRRQLILGGLIVVLAALVSYEVLQRPPAAAPRAPSNGVRAPAHPSGQAATSGPVPEVRLPALAQARPKPLAEGRNLFMFGSAPAAAPTAPRPGSAAPSRPVIRPTLPGGPTAPGAAPAPPIPLKFIGIVDAPGQAGRLAVLTDGRDVFHGREGDIIEGRYRILHIGVESVEMAYLDGSGRQLIRLTGGGL